jgi:glycine C-acetyltransferase
MDSNAIDLFQAEAEKIQSSGLWKDERSLESAQGARIKLSGRDNILNLCANNYLGLSSHPAVIRAAQAALDQWGYGLSSVRFICGTQTIHKQLETKLSDFLGMEDTILYSSCFDANGGVFEALLTDQDAIISDELNHASLIDGIRLCKAQRFRYQNNNMSELEVQLQAAKSARIRVIVTDGVFSMDGTIADLKSICDLADQYSALVLVDDSHAVGFMGKTGRGTHEHAGVMGRVDILTGTLGKALGGASGGYVSGKKEIIDLLRQRSRPYLFSNSLAPAMAAASIRALELLTESTELRDKLFANTAYYREQMAKVGFAVGDGIHPIVPVMLGDAGLAQEMSRRMIERGVLVVGFFYPVVPQGKARIRTQISAAHGKDDLDFAIQSFAAVKHEMHL